MSVRKKRFDGRFTEADHEALSELACSLRVTMTEAIRRAVAEKLRRVRAKQKAPAGTEAA
jgi:hypothetical protein